MRVRTRVHQQPMEMASCPLLFPLVLPLLLTVPFSGARIRILPSRLPASMMAFPPLLTSPPVFLPLLPAGARALSLRARVRLNRLLLHLFSLVTLNPWGASPLLFSPPLSLVFSIFSSSVTCPRVSSYAPPPLPSMPALLASLHSLLLHLRQVTQCSVPCPFLSDIACRHVSLCRSLIFLPPPSFLFPSATGE